MEYSLTGVVTSRWFLSLRQKVNEGISTSTQLFTADGQQSKPVFPNDTGPDIRFQLRSTGPSFDQSRATSEQGTPRSQPTTAGIENASDGIREEAPRKEEEIYSYSMWTQKVSPAVRACRSVPTAS